MNDFNIFVSKANARFTILEVAEQACTLFNAIRLVQPNWVEKTKTVYSDEYLDFSLTPHTLIIKLGHLLLLGQKDDIRRYNGIDNPDLSFSRVEGFRLTFQSEYFSKIAFNLGGDGDKNVVTISFWDDVYVEYQQIIDVFRSIIQIYHPVFMSAYVDAFSELFKDFNNGNHRVGWINYYDKNTILHISKNEVAFMETNVNGTLFSTINSIFNINDQEHLRAGKKVLDAFRFLDNSEIKPFQEFLESDEIRKKSENLLNVGEDISVLFKDLSEKMGVDNFYSGILDDFFDVGDYIRFLEEINKLDLSTLRFSVLKSSTQFIELFIAGKGPLAIQLSINRWFDLNILSQINIFLKYKKISPKRFCIIDPIKTGESETIFFVAFLSKEAFELALNGGQIDKASIDTEF